ncbi:hypothetical protein RISK_004210 [Rhodopirellula islandica]|uniref:Uncharacterized protein n=1 Tax=Rhodopirellula islandica TaxID=595434 RepID=A0A0J1BB73_RHOIS|nr:hypothetical protein RISK_004210 [Rhodopirellula islandica]
MPTWDAFEWARLLALAVAQSNLGSLLSERGSWYTSRYPMVVRFPLCANLSR